MGSPIPVDAFISAELPDICAQLAEVKVTQRDFTFEITMNVTPGRREECRRETLPFRMYVPLNMVSLPDGTYTVKVNGVSTRFQWPSEPTITLDPAMTVPAEWETYRNDAILLPSKALSARCDAFLARPPQEWTGVFALDEK